MSAINVVMTEEINVKVIQSFQKESKRLLNFIKQRVPTTEDAEDILQDVMYEFVNSFRVMRPVEQAASWMFRVARNRIIDFYRKKRPDLLEDYSFSKNEDDDTITMADTLVSKEHSADSKIMNDLIIEKLAVALKKLPDEQREVFVMHELEDKSFAEISEITGVNQNTLLSRKRYAVVFLREELKGLYKELFKN